LRATNGIGLICLALAGVVSWPAALTGQDGASEPGASEPGAPAAGRPAGVGRFPISFWCGPPPEFVTIERYRQIEQAGFTHVMPDCVLAGSIDRNRSVLDTAQEVGLQVFVHDERIPIGVPDDATKQRIREIAAEYREHPAMAGYFLFDEPSADDFPALAQTVAALREADPDHIAYVNILPNYASSDALGTPTYQEHVERYLDVVRPAILSYDHYSLLLDGDRPGFFDNLELVRRESARRLTPFWQIVLLTDLHGAYRRPTETEKRWQAMQTLAYGGKGVMFFTYWQPRAEPPWGEAVIDFDGTPTTQYDEVTRVNRDVQAIGRYLLPATSTQVVQRAGELDGTGVCSGGLDFEGGDLTVGVFVHGPACYVLFTNRDRGARTVFRVSVDTRGAALEALDKAGDRWRAVGGGVSGSLDLVLALDAGDGELYRWIAR
jgi:hypothetical protein